MGNNTVNVVDPTGGTGFYVDVETGEMVQTTDLGGDEVHFVFLVHEEDEGGYTQVGDTQIFEANDDGLVEFPATGGGFGRYAAEPDPGGNDPKIPENVGAGDHFLRPETAAKLFGLAYNLHESYAFYILFGDMSSSNGTDAWGPGSKHHAGHGHLGTRTGVDVDFRYLDITGMSFQDAHATTSSTFSQENTQRVYNRAAMFGFHTNYHGQEGPEFDNAVPASGHNDHGHLGYGN